MIPLSKSLPGESPYTADPTPKSGKLWFFRIFDRIFRLPKCMSKFTSKKCRKMSENRGFWPPKTLPKPIQNGFKIDVPKNMRFFIEFCSKNALLQKCRHRFRIGFSNTKWLSDTFLYIAFLMYFRLEKPTKNLLKTRPEPFKNRCPKHAVS